MKKINGLLIGLIASVTLSTALIQKAGNIPSFEANSSSKYVQTLSTKEEKSAINLNIKAKSAYLMDADSKTAIYTHDENKRLPIASMCKIMTLILAFDSIQKGDLAMDEEICVSPNAASMGGSQVFLEANGRYLVKELIKSIVVCSANDSCVALAERICGSESIFVDKMNEKARKIGANNTLFANCTGLPKEPQYSCAKDVALMLKELTSHEEYFRFGKIWTDKFMHPEGRFTEISNTNRLVRFYDGCDGGKTGFTNQAGFCLAATAKRGDMRVISVVIGEETSNNRFQDVRTMFDYAFANYQVKNVVNKGEVLTDKVKVLGGKLEEISLETGKSTQLFSKKGENIEYALEGNLPTSLKAPIKKGEPVGEIVVYKNNVECDRVPVLAAEDCPSATFIDNWRKVAQRWTVR